MTQSREQLLEKLHNERKVLEENIVRLERFLRSEDFENLSVAHQSLLGSQLAAMGSYDQILGARISLM